MANLGIRDTERGYIRNLDILKPAWKTAGVREPARLVALDRGIHRREHGHIPNPLLEGNLQQHQVATEAIHHLANILASSGRSLRCDVEAFLKFLTRPRKSHHQHLCDMGSCHDVLRHNTWA